jgi:hypothetical protein
MYDQMIINDEDIAKMGIEGLRAKAIPDRMYRNTSMNHIQTLGATVLARRLGVELVDELGYDMIYEGRKISVMTLMAGVDNIESGIMRGQIRDEEANRDCDRYVFANIDPEIRRIWFAGWIPKEEFYKQAKHTAVGDGVGCWTALWAFWGIKYDRLATIDTLHQAFHPRRGSG